MRQQKDCSVGNCSLDSHRYVTVAQLVEHGTHKPRVAGSIPARDTIFSSHLVAPGGDGDANNNHEHHSNDGDNYHITSIYN